MANTTADKLNALRTTKQMIRQAIIDRDVAVPEDTTFREYASKIEEIGDKSINNQDKTITKNGQYTADEGYTGLGTVTVEVAGETIDAYTKEETNALLASKQNTLTAGNGITIEDNVISATAGGSNLSALDDVTITDPTDGQVLTYNATDEVWENTTSTSLTNTATGSEGALAIGDGSTGSGRGSTAIGAGSSATEPYSVAVGHNAKANGGSVAIGNEATASAITAMAFGFGAKAQGSSSLAVGGVTASGSDTIAIGINNKAGGSNSISIGGRINNTSGQYSLRIGYNARQVSTYDLTGNYGIGIGYNAYTQNQYGIAIGSNANVKADYGIQLGRGSNSDANTFKVGLSDTLNVELLSADGTIPAERMSVLSGDSAPTSTTVGVLGQIYIDTATSTAYLCVGADTVTPAYTWKQITE